MNFYDDLVMQTQMNYSRHYHIYASGSTPYQLTDKKPLPYGEQIDRLVQEVKEADCVVVGGASGLSAAGGGNFYYEDNDSYRKYFRPFAEKYHFKGAFAGMMHPWKTREEYWGYLATFLHTTQTAPVRHSYLDLDALLKGKDFFILTTNQDTQFVKLYPCLLYTSLTTGTRQAWQRRQGFYRYLNVAALPCSLIPTPPDDE